MRSKLVQIAFCIVIAVSAGGCTPPVGNIGGAGAGDSADNLWSVPNRVVYDINDLFIRESDLTVFISNRGIVESISVKDVEIFIIEDPDFNADEMQPVPLDEWYPFTSEGRKMVVIYYSNLSTHYSVQVGNPYGANGNGGGNGSGSGSGSGITIEWIQ